MLNSEIEGKPARNHIIARRSMHEVDKRSYTKGSITINAAVLLCLLYILYSERLHPFLRALILVAYPTILATYCIHEYPIIPLILISLILLRCIDVNDIKLLMIGYIASIIP